MPQNDLLRFLSLNTALHTLTDTHLTPLRSVIKDIVRKGPPYPPQFEILPSLSHFVGEDDGRLFLDVLVRAPPKWLLERFEFGRWRDDIWKEAFERRFLPSWKRYKNPEDKWRAAFIRVLGRLDHRAVGCAHHESWTVGQRVERADTQRFIHLRRNGSGSLNRIYTRSFDPYDIMDELKHQGGVPEYPTVVRVLCHLQDVRVLAVGVLADKPSYYVNPNAHFVVHPPLLRPASDTPRPTKLKVPRRNSLPPPGTGSIGIPAPPHRANSVSFAVPIAAVPGPSTASAAATPEPYFPLLRTTSSGSVGAILEGGGSSRSLFAGFNWRPGRRSVDESRRRSIDENAEASSSTVPLARSWSRDGNRRRSWSFGRSRAHSTSSISAPIPILNNSGASASTSVNANANASAGPSDVVVSPTPQIELLSITPPSTHIATPAAPPAAALPTLPEDNSDPSTPPADEESSPPGRGGRFPYRPIEYPTPAYSHTQYPNHTPFEEDPEETTLEALRRVRDFRADYREIEEDTEDRVWSGNEGIWGADTEAMAEWNVEGSGRQRWVGPMM